MNRAGGPGRRRRRLAQILLLRSVVHLVPEVPRGEAGLSFTTEVCVTFKPACRTMERWPSG